MTNGFLLSSRPPGRGKSAASCCRLLRFCALALGLTAGLQAQQADEEKVDFYQKWLRQDVAYIVTPEEAAIFEKLENFDEKDRFIEQFWLNRDPDPRTSVNEFREEHYRRLAYANEHFGAGVPGWRTDRGRIYIIHGPPDGIDSKPTGGIGDRSPDEGGGTTAFLPYEKWFYRSMPGVGDGVEVEFVDRMGGGLYQLARDPYDKDALFYVPSLGKTLLESEGYLAKSDRVLDRHVNNPETRDPYRENTYGRGFERLLRNIDLLRPPPLTSKRYQALVTTGISYDPVPMTIQSRAFHAWDKAHIVSVSIGVPAAATAETAVFYGWVEDLAGRAILEFEQTKTSVAAPGNSMRIFQKRLPLLHGRYKLTLAMTDLDGTVLSTATHGIVVPPRRDGIGLSRPLLSRRVEAVLDEDPGPVDFVIGSRRIVPDLQHRYVPDRDRVRVYSEIYGYQIDSSTLEPSLRVVYRLKAAGEDNWIDVSASLVRQSDRYLLVHALPLWKYPSGCHALQIQVDDLISGRSATDETPICLGLESGQESQ